jgi:ArsR family transcriptional regulator, arsenate/arsenite/antimonite-responsive transcriptional repressor
MNAAFKALADPTRREILRLLRNGPRTSGEIADQFPTAWATVSRHLAQLRDSGLILSERQGQQIVYELNTTVFDDLIEHMLDWVKPSSKAGAKQNAKSGKRGGDRHA